MATVKQIILLSFFLIAIFIIAPVSAWTENFQNLDKSNYCGPIATWGKTTRTYSDTYYGIAQYNAPTGYKYPIPSNYWAVTIYDRTEVVGSDGGFGWSASASCGKYNLRFSWSDPARYECFRSDGVIKVYKDGVYVTQYASATLPYYFSIEFINNYDSAYLKDLVIGSTEKNVVGTIPADWFVAKDIGDPALTGLYNPSYNNVYNTYFHSTFSTGIGYGGNNTISIIGPDGVTYESQTSSSYTGVITHNLTAFFAQNPPFGFYTVQLSNDLGTVSESFVYKASALTGTSVVWDDTTYGLDESATMTYSIADSHWLTDDYEYSLKIQNTTLDDISEWDITLRPVSQTRTVAVTPINFPSTGTYYCTLYAVDKSSGEEILLAYDEAEFDVGAGGLVSITGTTFDAINATELGSCTVTATQSGSSTNTTSDPTTGGYTKTGLVTDESIGMNASKTNWTGFPVYFIPIEDGTYIVDLGLIYTGASGTEGGPSPGGWEEVTGGLATIDSSGNTTTGYWNATTDGTGLGGLIYNEPYWSTTSGATVTVSNATFNATKTTGDGGWYQFNETVDGICGGTYTITVSKTGYSTVTTTTTLVEDWFTRKDLCLGTDFTLTVNCRELTTNGFITDSDVYVELDTGDSTTTSTGVAIFSDVDYGVVGITASALGYYPGTGSVVVDSDTTTTVYLQKEGEEASTSAPTNSSGFGVGYAPKSVRFTVQTIWGKPIENCLVNATGYETTVGDWDWLYKVFGVDVNETPIATCTMGGYTDYKGDINFVMLEPVQYNCTFVKSGEINTTMSIYPKDDYYVVYATDFGNTSWLEGGSDINEVISVNVTKGDDGSTGWINISYTDTSGGTTGGTCYLNQTNPLDPDGDETVVDSYVIATNNWSENFTALAIDGEAYHVHVDPVHSTWDFERSYVVNFPKEKVNPLGLSDQELMMLATFLILFTGLLFGAISAPHAPLIMSFLGWIFLALGWLDAMLLTATAALTLATVLSVLTLVMVRSKKERFI